MSASAVGGDAGGDDLTATLRYANGSVGVVIYNASGDASAARERIDVVGQAGAAVLDDFHTLTLRRDGDEERIDGAPGRSLTRRPRARWAGKAVR